MLILIAGLVFGILLYRRSLRLEGASGSEAARNTAQLVLTTDDFSSMPEVVAEGRRSINNIQRSASMFLTKTIFAMLIGILFTIVSWQYPFQPVQMSFISTLIMRQMTKVMVSVW